MTLDSFLGKVKKGMSDVGEKAKVMVGVNQIRTQIYQLEREICLNYEAIGKKAFEELVKYGDSSITIQQTDEIVNSIKAKNQEIETLNVKIMELTGEKQCTNCSKLIPLNTKYCPECGSENKVTSTGQANKVKTCTNCGIQLDESVKFCGGCGTVTE